MNIDPRINQAIKLIPSIIRAADFPFAEFLITETNELAIMVLNSCLYVVKLDWVDMMPPIYFIINNEIYKETKTLDNALIFINDLYRFKNINSIFNIYTKKCTQDILAVNVENVQDNEVYSECINRKADSGAIITGFYSVKFHKKFMVSFFNGFPSLNKQDTLGINIFIDPTDTSHPIVNMQIYKKKINKIYNLYYRSLGLT